MIDFNEVQKQKRRSRNLTLAKLGAAVLIKDKKGPIPDMYRDTVKILFKKNEELDRELLRNGVKK